ncbi:MAG: hypothetical protein KME46_31595 [Brasilonema angustatum HA4187-MV1]|nr:hypothetical protein [Brasilonema angustatum HA4187-MV1]
MLSLNTSGLFHRTYKFYDFGLLPGFKAFDTNGGDSGGFCNDFIYCNFPRVKAIAPWAALFKSIATKENAPSSSRESNQLGA